MVIDKFFSRFLHFPLVADCCQFSTTCRTCIISTSARGCDPSEGGHASERVCDAGEGVNARVEASRVTVLVSVCTPVRVWVRACGHGCGCSVQACRRECRCGCGCAGVGVRVQCGRVGAVCGCVGTGAGMQEQCAGVGVWVQLRVCGQARRKLYLYIDPGNIVVMSR